MRSPSCSTKASPPSGLSRGKNDGSSRDTSWGTRKRAMTRSLSPDLRMRVTILTPCSGPALSKTLALRTRSWSDPKASRLPSTVWHVRARIGTLAGCCRRLSVRTGSARQSRSLMSQGGRGACCARAGPAVPAMRTAAIATCRWRRTRNGADLTMAEPPLAPPSGTGSLPAHRARRPRLFQRKPPRN